MAGHDIPIIGPIINRFIGTRNERFVKRYLAKVAQINALEPKIRVMTDAQLKAQVEAFRVRADKGETEESLIPEVFATAREAMDRAVGIRQVFNPERKFDATALPAEHRATFERVRAEIAALKPLIPQTYQPGKDSVPPTDPEFDEAGEFTGHADVIPPWLRVEVPPAFYDAVRALYPESRPPFRARPFDVQLVGAMVLAQGKIAEMRTGEGKTIVAPLATFLACVQRRKVHVVTVNDYLVQRDRDWTFPFFHALGLTVGAIHPMHMQGEDAKRQMYTCDVVYGTTAEFGFDYLRDNMKTSAEAQVQKRRDFAIVDEVDSTLIDEARTPLIISGPAHQERPRYELADKVAKHLVSKQADWQAAEDALERCKLKIKGLEGDIRGAADRSRVSGLQEELRQAKAQLPELEAAKRQYTQYYEVQLDRKSCHLTHDGINEAQKAAGVGSFYVGENIDLPHLLEQSLRAHVVFERDRDYVVMPLPDPETGREVPSIVIVDVNTGRAMIGRQWSDGLHQAVESKEGVPIKNETQTVATITIQNFFKMYKRLSGMTGTADTEAQEFNDIYKLDVVAIPTNRQVIRRDFDDVVLLRAKDKWDFIVEEIKNFHDIGRPVLVGTTSVEKSERLSGMLSKAHQIRHEVLNAKQHEREGHIVEAAGQLGAVTIATNMAGRGTDIKLQPVPREALLEHWLRRGLVGREITVSSSDEQVRASAYRRLAPAALELQKRDVETMDDTTLERQMLEHWAMRYTTLSAGAIKKLSNDKLRAELDRTGKVGAHRIGWCDTTEGLGGLHVIGTERHESRRIDNQLRGRSGRQGDKGSSRFFISLEDDLMKNFGGGSETQQKLLATLGMREGVPIESSFLSKRLESAQRKVEERNFQWRKNILEYDEVMEHQRRRFYGMRQRVLEGRDLGGLIFEFIEGLCRDACDSYLHADYGSVCVSEFVRQKLGVQIPASRLRRMEPEDLIKRVREDAMGDIRNSISVTMGEFLPKSIESKNAEGEFITNEVEFDSQGLQRWAKDRYGLELSDADVADSSPESIANIEDRIVQAAEARIEATDLSGVLPLLEKDFPLEELRRMVTGKFEIELSLDEIRKARLDGGADAIVKLIVERAKAKYSQRERELPIAFHQAMAMQGMRINPRAAVESLVRFANSRYGLGWTPDSVVKRPPQQVFAELAEANERFMNEGAVAKAVKAAQATKTDDELATWWSNRFNEDLPKDLRRRDADERGDAIRGRVEGILRYEQVNFERSILLQILDGIWREHLYLMDQLRESIGYRSFSQQDPRIEYKREGSRMFTEMMDNVRERVTDMIFKVSMVPQFGPPPGMSGMGGMGGMGGGGMLGMGSAAMLGGSGAGGGGGMSPGQSPPPSRGGGGPYGSTFSGPGLGI
jgi:preprotein translocase subunit SecA